MEKIINIFGDSIVCAGYVDEGGWVSRLRNYLEKNNTEEATVYNLGVNGNDTDGLLKRFKIENEARTPDLIIIAIGTNDACYLKSKNDNYVPLERFKDNLLEIIKQAKEFTSEIIFVGPTIVDESKTMPNIWSDDEFMDNKNIKNYNDKIKEICQKNDLLFIEMIDLLNEEDLEDGLHPNSKGHEKMFLRIKDFLVENKIV
ncbi:MAG: hypothetical protein UR60_C0022G0033 [Candidatus Moranbacteria bacterium GW2011_GWF2_34_56]|nr:MAG: hypothetical protein UR51_C0010G0007 [Candidatus Moranbacteria bacterium GW2011_GWF1_34_10]KKP64403.1 MAG: hypothetical protein UR60_C0022G0033 [Candidatus Moranbacteria bacterium GW2011_GWF2_34_56]HBI17279.1 hypothetical protein [Candidatus Moranbacteria bacterium]